MTYQDREISRRDVVKTAGMGAAAAATAVAVPATAKAAIMAKDAKHYAMVIDVRKCVGCQACTVACKAEFEIPLGATRSWVEYVEKGVYPAVTKSFLPRLCNQCSEPACVAVCPVKATWKRDEDGIVAINKDACIGCGLCVEACPYDARFLNPVGGKADKCDFCLHRVEQGLVPSCVNTCQGKARIIGDLNDPESEVSKLIAKHPVTVLLQERGTRPSVYYIGADHADPAAARLAGQYVRVDTHRPAEVRK